MNYKKEIQLVIFFFLAVKVFAQPKPSHNLNFNNLAARWDEAMPLGNGMLGALVWQKGENLRLSLDRADLWDERKALDISKINFAWVKQQVLAKDYKSVQQVGDAPYSKNPYPTKLPAAAIEFRTNGLGKVISNALDIRTGLNTVSFENGVVFHTYIHATQNYGYFSFENLPSVLSEKILAAITPQLITHSYSKEEVTTQNKTDQSGQGLQKLGYARGNIIKTSNSYRYRQPTYDNHYFEVYVEWKKIPGNKLVGCWTISCNQVAKSPSFNVAEKEPGNWRDHISWWRKFWAKSSVSLPDSALEKQYYLDMYKLGCVARAGAPAITLQAVWTADNGSLPPWKGDFHNDLNTQLSYWPTYTGNHLAEAATFTDWLWKIKANNENFTKQYFGVDGLNVPGVTTLNGDPMGGWIQYAMSPTTVAWCGQHFYWQWKYSMDHQFLMTRAYPYLHEAATFLENITKHESGKRKLPLSSSPEINDNRIDAWFLDWTNYDLSLAKFLFTAAGEVATAVGKNEEALHWKEILNQLPDLAVDETGLKVAVNTDLEHSHRHFSSYMALYPLALLDVNNKADSILIENSIHHIEKLGTKAWCGYSFCWMACIYARAYQAENAVKQLKIFTSNFCSVNSFHLNGDQKGGQYSGFTYRPFTLEGNFAFMQGVHELLLQSRNGYVEVFPAIPKAWQNVSFKNLRAEGAFLVNAKKENASVSVEVYAEQTGVLNIKLPFKAYTVHRYSNPVIQKKGNMLSVSMKKGEKIIFENDVAGESNH